MAALSFPHPVATGPQATAKLSGHRAMRRREKSSDASEESDESDAPSKKKAKSGKSKGKENEKPAKTKEARVWSERVEKLKVRHNAVD